MAYFNGKRIDIFYAGAAASNFEDASTAADLETKLTAENVGKVYRFTGTTDGTYTNGNLYEVVDDTQTISFTIIYGNESNPYEAESGMTFYEWTSALGSSLITCASPTSPVCYLNADLHIYLNNGSQYAIGSDVIVANGQYTAIAG